MEQTWATNSEYNHDFHMKAAATQIQQGITEVLNQGNYLHVSGSKTGENDANSKASSCTDDTDSNRKNRTNNVSPMVGVCRLSCLLFIQSWFLIAGQQTRTILVFGMFLLAAIDVFPIKVIVTKQKLCSNQLHQLLLSGYQRRKMKPVTMQQST